MIDIKAFRKANKITQGDLAAYLGLAQGFISQIENGTRPMPQAYISKILANKDWDISAIRQSMPVAQLDTSPDAEGTPYYEVDFCGGFDFVINDQTALPAGKINMPQYAKADCWVNITGHSMEPLISNGDIIALHRIDDWHTYILYGEIYGIMTDEYRTIKRVRKATNEDNIILEPLNPAFDTQEIPKSIIRQMWQVIGCIKKIF